MLRLRIPRSLPVSILLAQGLASAAMSVTEGRDHWEAKLDFQNPRVVSLGAGLHRIELGGAMGAEIGAPDLPTYVFHLALPPEGEPRIDVATDSAVIIPAHSWAAVPAPSMTSLPPVPAARDARPALTINTSTRDGIRILQVRVPLAEIRPDGSVRQAVRMRVRVGYPAAGQASTPLPRQIRVQVDNPAAPFGASATIGPRTASGRLASARRSPGIELQEMGNALVLKVGDRDFSGTAEDRIVRMTGAMILATSAARGLSSISLANLAVYAGNSDTLPVFAGGIATPRLEPIAIEVVDRLQDGRLDDDDEIRFFVQGTSIWKHNSGLPLPSPWELSCSPYAWQRTYLIDLAADPSAASPRLSTPRVPQAPATLSWVWHPTLARRDSLLSAPDIPSNSSSRESGSGTSWFWMLFDKRQGLAAARMNHPATTTLPGLLESWKDSGYVVVHATRESGFSDLDSARLEVNGTQPRRIADLAKGSVQVWGEARLREAGNTYGFAANPEGWAGLVPLSGYTVHYPRVLAYQAGKGGLRLFAPHTGAVRIRIDALPAGGSAYVLERNRLVRTARLENGHLLDSISEPETQYLVVGPDDLRPATADSLREWTPPSQDERMLDFAKGFGSSHPGLVVIAPAEFVGAAMQYAEFRRKSRSPFDVRIARLEDIYQLFSGGAQDPVAIRDFLRYARSTWGIAHCLLVGDGHYDYRGIRSNVRNWLPTWQDHSVETDDFFAYLDSAEMSGRSAWLRNLDLALGRVPARSEAEFLTWLRKLQAYESETNNGSWRNTILLAADDMMVRSGGSGPDKRIDGIIDNGNGHTPISERLAQGILDVRPFTALNKIYLLDYVENAALEKPVAMRDLLAALNRGVRLFTYFGHGSADQLADERLLDGASARAKLNNRDRPFVFFAGSCTVGRFDLPDALGLSEVLLMSPDKGAVATVTGSRPSFPGPNEALGAALIRNFLGTTSSGSMTLGEAFQVAKNNLSWETTAAFNDANFPISYTNREIYHLMGDPAMQVLPAPLSVSVSSIDAGDTVPSLERIAVQGALSGSRGSSRGIHITAQAGWIQKSARVYLTADEVKEQTYQFPGQMLFSGTLPLADTSFLGRFLTPAKLPFGDTTAFLTAYAWDGKAEGGVRITDLTLSGTGSAGTNDSIGPRIEFRACDSSYGGGIPFTSQAIVPQWGCIEVALSDSSGVSSLLGPDEGVVVEIPSVLPAFHPDIQSLSFQQAQVPLTLDERFPPGRYLLKVQARDQMGNPAEAQLQFDVQREFQPALYDVFNRPNPIKKGSTWFHFKVSADPDSNGIVPSSVDAVVRIHTVSGRLVRVLRTQLGPVDDKNPRAEWNLLDSFGQPVANGLYPYTVILRMRKPEGGYIRLERKGVAVVSR